VPLVGRVAQRQETFLRRLQIAIFGELKPNGAMAHPAL
jgi:hypothetical protein